MVKRKSNLSRKKTRKFPPRKKRTITQRRRATRKNSKLNFVTYQPSATQTISPAEEQRESPNYETFSKRAGKRAYSLGKGTWDLGKKIGRGIKTIYQNNTLPPEYKSLKKDIKKARISARANLARWRLKSLDRQVYDENKLAAGNIGKHSDAMLKLRDAYEKAPSHLKPKLARAYNRELRKFEKQISPNIERKPNLFSQLAHLTRELTNKYRKLNPKYAYALPLLLITLSIATLTNTTITAAAIGLNASYQAVKIFAFIVLIIALSILYLEIDKKVLN